MLVLLLGKIGSKASFGDLVFTVSEELEYIKTVALLKEQSKDSIMRTKFPGPLVMEKLKEKRASLVAQRVKSPACNAGDTCSMPRSERPPGEGNSNPLQYSCLENSTDGGTSQATVHGSQRVRHDWATLLSREKKKKNPGANIISNLGQEQNYRRNLWRGNCQMVLEMKSRTMKY